MKRSFVEKAQTWKQYSRGLPKDSEGKVRFTAVVNRRLDKIYRNKDLPLIDRFDAYVIRASWGHFCDFVCDRIPKTQDTEVPESATEKIIIKPLLQTDLARILGADPRRIQEIVQLRQNQGLMARREDLENPGLLVPLHTPVAPIKAEEQDPPGTAAWQAFSPRWDEEHTELAKQRDEAKKQRDEARETIERIERQKLADFKASQKKPASGDVETQPDSADGRRTPRPEIPDSPPENTAAIPAKNGPKANDFEAFAVSSTRQTLEPEEEGALRSGVSSSLQVDFKEDSTPSVGRSSMVQPTERPTGESGSPHKERVREWLEKRFKLPHALEDPELSQIADTIQTETHFKQFQEAAGRAKKPDGWRYFVTVALKCQKHQAKYATAGETEEEDPYVKLRMSQMKENKDG